MAIFSMVLSLLSGVALFLFGMSLMGDGLKLVAGNKLEAFLYRMRLVPQRLGYHHFCLSISGQGIISTHDRYRAPARYCHGNDG